MDLLLVESPPRRCYRMNYLVDEGRCPQIGLVSSAIYRLLLSSLMVSWAVPFVLDIWLEDPVYDLVDFDSDCFAHGDDFWITGS